MSIGSYCKDRVLGVFSSMYDYFRAQNSIEINSPSGQKTLLDLSAIKCAVDGVLESVLRYFNECARMQSPIEIAFNERGTVVSSIDTLAQQSRNYQPVQQNTYPVHVQGWQPKMPYYAPHGSPKSILTQQYSGDARIRNNVRHQKKTHRVVETIRQTRLRKRDLPHRKYSSIFR